MRVFELHFNPKAREDKMMNSFVYEPENVSEKRLGNLYMAGELTQVLPQNSQFLNNLALVLKQEHYKEGFKRSYETSLREALKRGNEFLDKEAKGGNVSWLGNLSFAVLNFKDFVLSFTKVGGIKILLQKEKDLLDIGQDLEFQDTEPYPLKIFGNIATGKLAQNDKIIILTQDVFSALTQKGNFFTELSQISDEKGLKKLLKINKPILSEVSGICLLLMVNEELQLKESLSFSKKTLPKFSFPSFSFSLPRPAGKIKKNLILILVLLLILAGSFFVFKGEREKELQSAQGILSAAQSKVMMAENFLILKDKEKARTLLEEARDILTPLTKKGVSLNQEALFLQKSINERLESEF